MPHIITHYFPELDESERSFLAQLTATMPEADVQQFAIAYRQERKDPQTIFLMATIGIADTHFAHCEAMEAWNTGSQISSNTKSSPLISTERE
jgi:hypothetical protein